MMTTWRLGAQKALKAADSALGGPKSFVFKKMCRLARLYLYMSNWTELQRGRPIDLDRICL